LMWILSLFILIIIINTPFLTLFVLFFDFFLY
jgi:hypothetical protein